MERSRDVESKYLLSGLPVWGLWWLRGLPEGYPREVSDIGLRLRHLPQAGRCVCTNHVEMPMRETGQAVLDAVLVDVLQPDILEAAVQRAIDRLAPGARQVWTLLELSLGYEVLCR